MDLSGLNEVENSRNKKKIVNETEGKYINHQYTKSEELWVKHAEK